MTRDVRFAVRQLLKSPGFTVLALLTLAIGIGLNTAIFSVIDDLFLRGLPYAEPARVVHLTASTLGQTRLMMRLLGLFAGVALVLATVGVYGAVAYTVRQRTGERRVRLAFGAETGDILRLVVDQGMRPVVAGLAVGLAAALVLGRLIESQRYQTSTHNPLLLAATMGCLGLAALLACVFPARRASRLNPVEAMRAE
jgi:ABC-type antimicrobial peptide transport system permease subunit